MKGLDTVLHGNDVSERVYDSDTNRRLVWRFLFSEGSYCGAWRIGVAGCNMVCTYCYVNDAYLTAKGARFDREMKQKKIKWYTPAEAVEEVIQKAEEKGGAKCNFIIGDGEPFLSGESFKWVVDVLREFAKHPMRRGRLMWIETNAVLLAEDPKYIETLAEFREFLHLFVSTKHSPEWYTQMSKTKEYYADHAFKALEALWATGINAFFQGPMANVFIPERDFDWYFKRLTRIHPAAPLIMDVDHLTLLPPGKIQGKLKVAGIWNDPRRKAPGLARKLWKEFLEEKYGRKMKRLSGVDTYPEDCSLIKHLVFNREPIESCHLFEKTL